MLPLHQPQAGFSRSRVILFRVLRQTSAALCSTLRWSARWDTPSLEATWRSVGAAVLPPTPPRLPVQAAGQTDDGVSCLQESFKVKFEANPKYVEEFIQINVTATRSEKRPHFPRVSVRAGSYAASPAVTAMSCPPPCTTTACTSPSPSSMRPASSLQCEYMWNQG